MICCISSKRGLGVEQGELQEVAAIHFGSGHHGLAGCENGCADERVEVSGFGTGGRRPGGLVAEHQRAQLRRRSQLKVGVSVQ